MLICTCKLPVANSAFPAQNIKYSTHAGLERKICFSRKSFALCFVQVSHPIPFLSTVSTMEILSTFQKQGQNT